MGKWQQMKCSSVLGPGSHTKDTYSVDAQDNTLKQCQSSLKKGCQLPGPQTLRASPSGLLKKLLACCVWFTIFHLAFYKLYQSTGCNSSNFFHSSHAMWGKTDRLARRKAPKSMEMLTARLNRSAGQWKRVQKRLGDTPARAMAIVTSGSLRGGEAGQEPRPPQSCWALAPGEDRNLELESSYRFFWVFWSLFWWILWLLASSKKQTTLTTSGPHIN